MKVKNEGNTEMTILLDAEVEAQVGLQRLRSIWITLFNLERMKS